MLYGVACLLSASSPACVRSALKKRLDYLAAHRARGTCNKHFHCVLPQQPPLEFDTQ